MQGREGQGLWVSSQYKEAESGQGTKGTMAGGDKGSPEEAAGETQVGSIWGFRRKAGSRRIREED